MHQWKCYAFFISQEITHTYKAPPLLNIRFDRVGLSVRFYFDCVTMFVKNALYKLLAKQSRSVKFDNDHSCVAPDHSRPNYVSSQGTPLQDNYRDEIITSLDKESIMQRVEKSIIGSCLIWSEEHDKRDWSLHYRVVVGKHRFYDDMKIWRRGNQLQFVSASRVGYCDFGVNSKRIEVLRSILEEGYVSEPGSGC